MQIPGALMTFVKWLGAGGLTTAGLASAAGAPVIAPVVVCGLLGLWLAGELKGAADAKKIETRLTELLEKHGSLQAALEAFGAEAPDTKAKIDELLGAMQAAVKSDAKIEKYVAGNQTLLLDLTQFVADQFDELRQVLGLADEDRIELLMLLLDLKEGQKQLALDHEHIIDEIRDAKKLLEKLTSAKGAEAADKSITEDLASAAARVARDAARGGATAARVLASNAPGDVVDFLNASRDRYKAAKDIIDERFNDELIEHDREIAATAYVTGRIDDCEAALQRILDQIPGDLDAHLRLGNVYSLLGKMHDAHNEYQAVLNAALNDEWRALALGGLGLIEQTRGDLDAAEAYHKQSLAINEELGLKQGTAAALGNLGLIEKTRGNLDAAEDYHKRSLAINEELGRKEGMANQFGNLGLIEKTRGNLGAAEDYLKRSLAINEELGRKEGLAKQLGNLGLIEWMRGNLDGAEDYLKRSLAIDEVLGRKEGMANQFGNLGLIEEMRGNLGAAEDYLRRSLAINEELGRKEGLAKQLGNLGLIEQTRGNLDAAEDYHKRSLAINEELGRKEGMAIQLGNLGLIERTRGNLDEAEAYHKRSLAIEEELGRKEGMASDLGNLGLIEQTRGNLVAAEAYHKRALVISEELGSKEGMANQLGNLGVIEHVRGNLDEAEAYLKRSLAINEELGRKEGMAIQLGNLGLIERTRGNIEAAREYWREALCIFKEVGMAPQVEQTQQLLDSLPLPPSPAQ